MQQNFCIVSANKIWNYLAGVKAYVSCDMFTTVTRNALNRIYFTLYTISSSMSNLMK